MTETNQVLTDQPPKPAKSKKVAPSISESPDRHVVAESAEGAAGSSGLNLFRASDVREDTTSVVIVACVLLAVTMSLVIFLVAA